MRFAYIDETGDTGDPNLKGATGSYGLGCILMDADQWAPSFEAVVDFRRRLRDTYGIPMRAELKANYLIRGSGPLRPLNIPPRQRSLIYRAHFKVLEEIEVKAFGVVVDKTKHGVFGDRAFELTWETMIQRLERGSTKEGYDLLIFHDEGEDDHVRRMFRKARRRLTAGRITGDGTFNLPARRFVEDPNPRASQNSYFIQFADLVAYAAWRRLVPPGAGAARVAPQSMWDNLGGATNTVVDSFGGQGIGIVSRSR